MKKNHIIILATILLTSCSHCQNEISKEGIYKGVFTHGNFTDNISFKIKKDSTDWKVFFTSLEQNAFQIPVREVVVKNESLNFKLQSDVYTYDFINAWNDDKTQLSGILQVDTVSVPYTLKKQNSVSEDAIESKEVHFHSKGLQLGGTIWKSKTPNKKAIIFITSSGGADRSGSRAEAIYFANKGYTTFHYDKRGTGVSEGDWQSAIMEELLSDDIKAIENFSEQTGIPLSQIGIKGSSQGATKIPYILNRLKDLNFGIVVSCPGSTLLESDLNYWKNNNREALGDNLENAIQFQRKVFEHIAGKYSTTELEEVIEVEKSKPWFPKIWIPNLDEVQTDKKLLYSPVPYFQKVEQPILIVQGTTDEIIPLESSKVISDALEMAQNKDYKVVLLKNANHSMYFVGESDFPYWAKLHPEYLKTIEGWVNTKF